MKSEPILLPCSSDEIKQLKALACSTTAGIWRIKRAKALLGVLGGESPVRMMYRVRVPVLSIVRCIREFNHLRMAYFDQPTCAPTTREAAIEKMLAFLGNPPPATSDLWGALTLRFIGLSFTAHDIQMIRDIISDEPTAACSRIAEVVCRRLQLLDSHGRPRLTIVKDILNRMAMDNLIFLPPREPAIRRKPKIPPKAMVTRREISGTASHDSMTLTCVVARKPEESILWSAIIHHYHYIPGYRLFGPQLRYLVYVSTDREEAADASAGTVVAALSFSSSAWRVSCRDDYIGWNDAQRIRNLQLVINNSRFLILPWIRIPNLASRILGAMARQAPRDWEAHYGRRPVLLETFVEQDRFCGTCYRAANWIEVGSTVGYSLHGHEKRRSQPSRAVFLLPLHRGFRRILCRL
jgi:hypothetical protein